jgi:putative MFS transporter
MVAWLPFAALAGTAAGSFIWGALADIYGRRATILLSSVIFIGTSICGAMPDFWWNVLMCLLLGLAAGGMLPVTYALLAEIMPTKHRGWCLVLIGGIGAIGGYLAASVLSALLQPAFGWRIMWFLNLPTGLLLIALSPLLPESARFLQLMGLAAGGMLPVTYALLAEIMPTRHRGWCLVLIGGIGAVGGFFAASALSALLQPVFGWRIMWFLNLPTGLILIALSPFLPESARFLQQMGRGAEARAMLARYGAKIVHEAADAAPFEAGRAQPAVDRPQTGITVALTLAALAWSLVNFGLLLWLPGELVEEGRSVGAASGLIAQSTLLAAPVILFSTWLYSRWSTKGSLVLMLTFMSAGLLGLLARSSGIAWLDNPLVSLTVLVIGSCGVIAILLPYAAENYALRVRGRATGWVAGCSKLGGVLAQVLAVLGVVPAFGQAALVVVIPSVISLVLIALWGRETRGSDLRSLEPQIDSPR